MNVTQTASPPPSNSSQNPTKFDLEPTSRSPFDGHLILEKSKLDLYAMEREEFDKEEIYWQEVEEKRKRDSAEKKMQTEMATNILFFRHWESDHWESDLAGEAKQFKNLAEREAIRERIDGRKAHPRTPVIVAEKEETQTAEILSAPTAGKISAKSAKGALKEAEAFPMVASDKAPTHSINETADRGGQLKHDAGRSSANPVASQAIADKPQNSAYFSHRQGGAHSGKGRSGPAVAKGETTLNTAGGIHKFDSMLRPKPFPESSSRSQVDVKEIAGKIKLMISTKKREIVMRLTPEHLGKLEFRLKKEGDHMSGLIKVENHSARKILEAGIAELRQTLESQGISIENFTILTNEEQSSSPPAFSEGKGQNRNLDESGTQNAFSDEEPAKESAFDERENASLPERGTSIYV